MRQILWVTMIMGAVCALHALWLFLLFSTVKRPGARAVRWMLFGETVGMVVFTYFSYLEYIGKIRYLSPAVATLLRWLCFAATMGSTVHLRIMIRQVDRQFAEREDK